MGKTGKSYDGDLGGIDPDPIRKTFLAGMELCDGNENGLPFPYSLYFGRSLVGVVDFKLEKGEGEKNRF